MMRDNKRAGFEANRTKHNAVAFDDGHGEKTIRVGSGSSPRFRNINMDSRNNCGAIRGEDNTGKLNYFWLILRLSIEKAEENNGKC